MVLSGMDTNDDENAYFSSILGYNLFAKRRAATFMAGDSLYYVRGKKGLKKKGV